jgi:hypothetical protein
MRAPNAAPRHSPPYCLATAPPARDHRHHQRPNPHRSAGQARSNGHGGHPRRQDRLGRRRVRYPGRRAGDRRKGGVVTPGFVRRRPLLGADRGQLGAASDDQRAAQPRAQRGVRRQYGLNPESVVLPVARLGGMTSARCRSHRARLRGRGRRTRVEGGGSRAALFAGQAAVSHLGQGRRHPDAAAGRNDGASNWARPAPSVAGGAARRGLTSRCGPRSPTSATICATRRPTTAATLPRDCRLSRADLEALIPVVEGRMPVIVDVHRGVRHPRRPDSWPARRRA